jgi:hypothetical protein
LAFVAAKVINIAAIISIFSMLGESP